MTAAEPASAPNPQSPIDGLAQPAAPDPRRPWMRRVPWLAWVAAGLGAVVVTVAIVVLVSGRSAGLDPAAGYISADAVVYLEVQLDLPGQQRTQLKALLDRFPAINVDDLLGPTVATKLDEALASAGAPVAYSGDIAPWFTGRVAMALDTYPSALRSGSPDVPAMVLLLGTRDAAAARTAVDTIRGSIEDTGVTFTSSQVDGVTVWVTTLPGSDLGTKDVSIEIAVSEDQVLIGLNGGGRSALDVHAGRKPSLAKNRDLAALTERLPRERVATFVVNGAALLQGAYPSPLPSAFAAMMAGSSAMAVESVSFDADALRIVSAGGPFDDKALQAALATDLAAEVPGDALIFVEAPGFGDSMATVVQSLKLSAGADPATAGVLDQLEQFESAAGFKLDEYFDWAGGIAIAAGSHGAEPWGGVVFEVSDAALAGKRVSQLDTLLALAAADPSSGVKLDRRTVAGTQVTRVRMAVDPSLGVPFSDVVVEYAMTDKRLLLGVGDGFVSRALDLAAADSLQQAEAYRRALTAVGGDPSHGAVFVDLAATRTWVESLMPADVAAAYKKDVAPNLEPLDYLAMATRRDGHFTVSTMLLKLR